MPFQGATKHENLFSRQSYEAIHRSSRIERLLRCACNDDAIAVLFKKSSTINH